MSGEHSCMVLKPLEANEMEGSRVCSPGFLHPFYRRFRQRFMRRLPLCFQELDYKLAISILDPKINYLDHEPLMSSNRDHSMLMKLIISADDLKLLGAYANNRKEYTKVGDMVPLLPQCYFEEQLPVTLSYLQASILLCMGLQLYDVTYIEGKMNIERQQVLSLFRKVMTRFYKYLYHVLTEEFQTSFSKPKELMATFWTLPSLKNSQPNLRIANCSMCTQISQPAGIHSQNQPLLCSVSCCLFSVESSFR